MNTEVKATKSPKKTKISFDDYHYNLYLDLEQRIYKVYEQLKVIADESLGVNKVNIGAYLKGKNSADYLVNEYANLWLSGFAPHLSREHLFTQQTNVSIEGVMQLRIKLDTYLEKMGKHAPTINSKGITSNLKKSAFNQYLDESKRAKYEALTNMLDCIEALRKYYPNGNNINFVRAYDDLQFDGLGIKVNLSRFTE